MKITCKFDDDTGETKVEFKNIRHDIQAMDFLKDCLGEIEREYIKTSGKVFKIRQMEAGDGAGVN